MDKGSVRTRLAELVGRNDEWFTVMPGDGPDCFTVDDGRGARAEIVLADRWLEIRAGRPFDRVIQLLLAALAGGPPLIRVALPAGTPPPVDVSGRVYFDGFSEQALFRTISQVLAVAGPEIAPAPSLIVPAPAHVHDSPVGELQEETALPAGAPASLPAAVEPERAEASAPGMTAPAGPAVTEPPRLSVTAPVLRPPPASQAEPAEGKREVRAMPVEARMREETPPTDIERPPDRMVGATVQMTRPPRPEEPVAPSPAHPTPLADDRGAALARPCASCGADVQPGERFCIRCGTPQASEPPTRPVAAGSSDRPAVEPTMVWRRPSRGALTCRNCGAPNPADSPTCQTCGTALTGAHAGGASGQPAAGARPLSCARCGYANPAGNRFCQGCGASLIG